MPNIVRASVTASAGGVNLCPNPVPMTDLLGWVATDGGAGSNPTLTFETTLPAPSPIGYGSCVRLDWNGPGGSTFPSSLTIPHFGLTTGATYTVSLWVYVPVGVLPGIAFIVDGAFGTSTTEPGKGTWQQINQTFVANGTDNIVLWPTNTTAAGDYLYATGGLIVPGSDVGAFALGGGQAGLPVEVLVDGSDTPITANGLPDYTPTPGDRLLVQKVGGMVEVLQYLNRGTVPYLSPLDITDLQANVDVNTQSLSDQSALVAAVNDDLQDYKVNNDDAVSTLQSGHDVLDGFANAGVSEDYFYVGNDPALSSLKLVQISTFVQGGMSSETAGAFSTYFNLWDQDDLGDVTYSGAQVPPMTQFYNAFTAQGIAAQAWK